MRILIIGGTGFIGSRVTRRLAEAGHTIMVFHRGETAADVPDDVLRLHGDRNYLSQVRSDLEAFDPDVVLDVIPYTERQAQEAVRMFERMAQRFVILSSGDVYRNYDGLRGASSHPPDPVPLSEEAPLRKTRYPYRAHAEHPNDWMYDYDKILVERAYQEASVPCTVLRLPAAYGPGDPQHRIWPVLKRMDDGRPAILLDTEHANWRWTRGYVDNVAAAIARATTHDHAAGRTYNLGAAETPTEAEWVHRIAHAAEWAGEVIPLAPGELPDHLRPGFDFAYGMAMDTRHIRDETDFSDPVTQDVAMARTVAWTRAHPPPNVDPTSFNYTAEDEAIAAHRASNR